GAKGQRLSLASPRPGGRLALPGPPATKAAHAASNLRVMGPSLFAFQHLPSEMSSGFDSPGVTLCSEPQVRFSTAVKLECLPFSLSRRSKFPSHEYTERSGHANHFLTRSGRSSQPRRE